MIKQTLKEFFFSLSQEQLESFGKSIIVTLGSLFSPTWHLLKTMVLPLFDIHHLTAYGWSPAIVPNLIHEMRASGPETLSHLVPALFLCLLCSLVFLLVCAQTGKLLARLLVRRYHPVLAKVAV